MENINETQKEKDARLIEEFEQKFYKLILHDELEELISNYCSKYKSLPNDIKNGLLTEEDINRGVEDFRSFGLKGIALVDDMQKDHVEIKNHQVMIKIAAIYFVKGPEAAFNALKEMEANNPMFGINMVLGDVYYYGIGTSEDLELAIKYYEIAKQKGETEESLIDLIYQCYYEKADEIRKKYGNTSNILTPDEYEYHRQATHIGSVLSKGTIGISFLQLSYNEKDQGKDNSYSLRTAIQYFENAIQQGERDKQYRPSYNEVGLAVAYNALATAIVNKDNKDDPNNKKAIEYFMKAAEVKEYPAASHNLGIVYLKGLGIDEDKEEAIKWFTRARDLGFEPSKEVLEDIDKKEEQKK